MGEEHVVVHLEGLLHLASMAVLLTAGYIGVDRVRRDEADNFKRTLQDVGRQVREKLRKIDVLVTTPTGDEAHLIHALNVDAAHMLCHVANIRVFLMQNGQPVPLGWFHRTRCAIARQKHIPVLAYFRNRFDRKFLTLLGLAVTLLFLVLISAETWQWPIMTNTFVKAVVFFVCAFTILVVFFTAACAYPLLKVNTKCSRLLDELAALGRELIQFRMNKGWEDFNGDLG